MERQYTASAFTICENKVLLMYNKKLKKWLQPGGHILNDELPNTAAVRETFEETGIAIDIVCYNLKASELPTPIYIERYKNKIGDMIDFQYCGIPVGGNLYNEEDNQVNFFSLEEMENMNVDEEIKNKTKEIIDLFNFEFKLLNEDN